MMKRIALILGVVVLLGGGTLSGCVVSDNSGDSIVTCDNLDTFLADCSSDCSASWACEDNYDSLDSATQSDLDACSDCLAESAASGQCADCTVPELGIDSCLDFMDSFLNVDCWQ